MGAKVRRETQGLRALVVSAGWSIAETVYVLKAASLYVTVLCSRSILNTLGSLYDAWIPAQTPAPGESRESAMIGQLASLFTAHPEAHDWVLLRDDSLLAALYKGDLDLTLKLWLSPTRAAGHLDVLHSKRGMAKFLREAGFACPASMGCDSFEEIIEAAAKIGFPLLVKIEGTSGGTGVYRADSLTQLRSLQRVIDDRSALVEQFVEGLDIAIEPLFLSGELIAYNYSRTLRTIGQFGVCYERKFFPCESIAPTLQRMGRLLRLNCFANISCILDRDGRHLFYEVDLRPNVWVSHGRLVGADFSQAIRRFVTNPNVPMECVLSTSIERTLPHFERDIIESLANLDWPRLRNWMGNRNHCWEVIPRYDRMLVFRLVGRTLKALIAKRD
jgi:hypothetical protein